MGVRGRDGASAHPHRRRCDRGRRRRRRRGCGGAHDRCRRARAAAPRPAHDARMKTAAKDVSMEPIHMAGPWVTEHEIKVVEDCMRRGWYNYEYVETFQREFAAY